MSAKRQHYLIHRGIPLERVKAAMDGTEILMLFSDEFYLHRRNFDFGGLQFQLDVIRDRIGEILHDPDYALLACSRAVDGKV
jgi:hypothetical protein